MEDWIKIKNKFAEERIAVEVARIEGSLLDPRDNKEKWDFETLEMSRFRHETKADWDSERWGNAYLEVKYTKQGKPSGLTSTESDKWWHYLPKERLLVMFNPQIMLAHLRQALKDNLGGYRLTAPDRGDSNSQGVVVSIPVLLKLPFVSNFPFHLSLKELALQLGVPDEVFDDLEKTA